MVKAKSFITSPPNRKRANTVKKVVVEVITVRLKVWLILVSRILSKSCFLKILKLSLTLSKMTIVSFNEYPTMVSIAATTGMFISLLVREKIPRVIKTSWNKVKMAATP